MFGLQNFNPFLKSKHALRINASIVNHQNGIFAVYRSQHLYGYDGKSYIVELNSKFEIINFKNLKAANNNPAFEDVRLFSIDNVLFAFYTYLPFVEGEWVWEFGVGFGIVDIERGVIKHQISLRKLGTKEQNKNWIPYFYKNELFLITDFSPFLRIIKIFNKFGKLVLKEYYQSTKETPKWKYGEIRGSTPFISQPNSKSNLLYGFVHSHLSNYNGYSRYYFYTVIRFNPQTKEVQYHPKPLGEADDVIDEELTDLWKKSTNGKLKVVFPIGIMNHNKGVIVSFGIDDIRSSLKHFKWDYLIGLFN